MPATTAAPPDDNYVLNRDATEYERLRAQARAWEPATSRLFDHAADGRARGAIRTCNRRGRGRRRGRRGAGAAAGGRLWQLFIRAPRPRVRRADSGRAVRPRLRAPAPLPRA